MRSFRYFSKSAFWSPFLVGLVAIFALPHLANGHLHEDTQNSQVFAPEMIEMDSAESEQPYFVRFDSPIIPFQPLQAVIFCEFFTASYRLIVSPKPPIRAGPLYA
ncbi:DUF2547 family protein [Muribacter muris]|uniref:DUF2547 family protein n=1 Tax=Muribacter muris TaxID=67855 RepID=A0A4Y9JY32_9PAST|nr:secA translation cis-regulator SecM [Muribacter muris]MBF0785090.1 DUF2547 family protein [Muribacter muris]MBF0826896.1 DUF2547 family protein [Muribacter muris]TFV10182.1 DUF2547 family protein [Muribacter muris]